MKKDILKHARLVALSLWGFISFLVMCGEPVSGTSLLTTTIVHIAAIASLLLCCLAVKRAFKAGLLPVDPDSKETV